MKTTLQDPRNHWRNVGATAARQGLPVEAALTKCESINALIREGYNRHIRRIARHAAHQAEIEARNRKRRFNRLAGW